MKKLMIAAAIAAMMGTAMADRPARPAMGPRGMGPVIDPVARVMMHPKMAEILDLSEEQMSKIREIRKASAEAMKPLNEKMNAAMAKQTELVMAEEVDESAAMAAVDELFEIRKEAAKAQTKQIIQIKAVLTSAQLAKAKEEIAKRVAGRRGNNGPNGEKRSKKAKKAAGESAAKE